ncbi:hypothetical protein lerEdw1_009601 [Lerista edwardsae]|nr:hypothetical protein lerEdw1_009601 [Lerista edwardsae]
MEQVLGLMLLLGSTASMPAGMRIIGGFECVPHSQPWHVFIYDSQLTRCGGALIDEHWVLTAAHCLGRQVCGVTGRTERTLESRPVSFLRSNLRIHLGEHDLRKHDYGEQLSRAVKFIRHPDFEPDTLKNDIMLLRLDPPARLSRTIQIIPMAEDCVPIGTQCVVSGWGTTTYPQVNYAYTLTCIDAEVLPKDMCQSIYGNYYAEKEICAGLMEGGKDSCQGDSGSPMTCNGIAHGLVSWGADHCAAKEMPAIYTEICKFREWIEETMSIN